MLIVLRITFSCGLMSKTDYLTVMFFVGSTLALTDQIT